MSPLSRGRIIWATVPDPQGRNPKRRPLVILTPTADITPDGVLQAVAATTRTGVAPAEVCVPLPWDRNGHPRTKLREACVAVCTWVAELRAADIEEYAGVVPGRQLVEIENKVNALRSSLPDPPPEANEPAD